MISIRVRRAADADIPAMADLKRLAGVAAWPHILPVEVIETLGMPDRWAEAVHDPSPRTVVLVAEVDSMVRGFAITRPSGDADARPSTGELDGLYTSPEVWGAGVGRRLLVAAEQALRDAGFSEATLWTATENHRPRRIYERAGWQTDGTIRSRSLNGVDFEELRYRRSLAEIARS